MNSECNQTQHQIMNPKQTSADPDAQYDTTIYSRVLSNEGWIHSIREVYKSKLLRSNKLKSIQNQKTEKDVNIKLKIYCYFT